MSEQFEYLQSLAAEQRELIRKLLDENLRLNTLTQTMHDRIQDLEQQHVVIDEKITELPIDFDLIPESELNNS